MRKSPPYVQEDTLVRALRFMDTLLQRDNLQKAAFLKDLTSFWTRFDSRILCYKVSTRQCSVITRCNVRAADVSSPCSMLQSAEHGAAVRYTGSAGAARGAAQ